MDKLSVYNQALEHLGSARLASLTADQPSRYALDDAWESSVQFILSDGNWNWATRTLELDADPSIETQFGFLYGFSKPDDWSQTQAIASDGYFQLPLKRYEDESIYWFADVAKIYVRYSSTSPLFGMNFGLWSTHAELALAAYLAYRTCRRITGSSADKDVLFKLQKKLLADAKSQDGKNEPARFYPPGNLVLSRTNWGPLIKR